MVQNVVSKASLTEFQKFFQDAEVYPFTTIYPNIGWKGTQVGNGMTGDRANGTLEISVNFLKNGNPKVHINWPTTRRYLTENGLTLEDGYSQTDIDTAKAQYNLIYKNSKLKRGFVEVAESEIRDMLALDPGLTSLFKSKKGKAYFYFNLIQYYSDFNTLPSALINGSKTYDRHQAA